MGNSLICKNESVFQDNLTYGKSYAVLETDITKNQIRISGDSGRKVWIPSYCFCSSMKEVPKLTQLTIDDEIRDSSDANVEVTLSLSDGTERWCTFMTPANLERILVSEQFFFDRGTVFVPSLSRESVDRAAHNFIRQGQLFEVTRLLKEPTEDDAD